MVQGTEAYHSPRLTVSDWNPHPAIRRGAVLYWRGMLQTPSVSVVPVPSAPDLGSLWHGMFNLTLDPIVLLVLLVLVGIFTAVLSVMLVYHWRRFPFEMDLFRRVEHWYLFGVAVLLAAAVFGIFAS